MPTSDTLEGIVDLNTEITLSITTIDAEIWYTLDGSVPLKNGFNCYIYTDPIVITETVILKAIGVKEGFWDSTILVNEYKIVTL